MKVSINTLFHLRFTFGAVLHLSRDQCNVLLKLCRLPYLIESPFGFSLKVAKAL